MNARELLEGIRDADRHRGGIRCLRLLQLDDATFRELANDVERLCARQHPSVVSDPAHITNWTRPFGEVLQYSLLNASGRYDDFSDDHELTCFGKRFHEAAEYPALHRFIARFPHAVNFRINVLGRGAGLSPHEEQVFVPLRSGRAGARLRFHLPIVSNERAELTLDGDVYHLDEGTLYFVNHGCVHAAKNGGDAARIHLVWDMLFTRETFDVMFASTEPVAPTPLRVQRMGAHRALPPRVAIDDEASLAFCEPQ